MQRLVFATAEQPPMLRLLTQWIALVLPLVGAAPSSITNAAEPLSSYNVEPGGLSISGISSGAYMAIQIGIAHSQIVSGVGVFAGGPYRCAEGSVTQALGVCMQGLPDVETAIAETVGAAAAGRIDPPENLAQQRIWLFSGYNDGVVKQPVVDRLRDYYLHFIPSSQVYYQDSLEAGHGIVTLRYGDDCPLTGGEFINDCDYDGAGLLLQHIYGRLAPPADEGLGGQLIAFDQDAFVVGDSLSKGMAREAFVYVPATCAEGQRCRAHVAFHGCRQYAEKIGDAFYRNAGYNQWADSNGIIVLYPQTVATTLKPFNPKGCWDWWGYNGPDYAFKDGAQIAAVHAMMLRLSEGAGPTALTAPETAPMLVATDASASSVALSWLGVSNAQTYHVSRAESAAGPFIRITDHPVVQAGFADHELRPQTPYFYRIQPSVGAAPSNTIAITTRAEAPACDPYFSDNLTHTKEDRATAWFGLTFARGSWDYMGLWNVFTDTALYRDDDGYQTGVCP
jgi:poly(3-hydroxybutyrate) depolymerase